MTSIQPTASPRGPDGTATRVEGRVLVVEDDAVAAILLTSIVERMGPEVVTVESGADAVEALAQEDFDLVLLDVGLPDVDGYQVAARMRTLVPAERLPIVFVSGEQDAAARVQGFSVGGADFVTKPYDVAEVRARVLHQLEMRRLRRQLEEANDVLEQRVAERTVELADRNTQLTGEIERRRALETELRRLAESDPVTGVLNQRGLRPRLDRWRAGDRSGRWIVAAEIDGWESVVGLVGHRDGDEVLRALAERIHTAFPDAPVARLGASLFVIALTDAEGSAVSGRLRTEMTAPVHVGRRSMRMSVTIGAVEDGDSARNPDEILRDAMLALHAAKQRPGAAVVLDDEARVELEDGLALEQDLWGAAARGELRLQYQPLYRAESMRIGALEALVRWNHPRRGLVSPGRFIPIAERSGAIEEIGEWTLAEATGRLGRWHVTAGLPSDVSVAVNVSAVQAVDLGLPDLVRTALDTARLEPSALELELTETAVLDQARLAAELLNELRGIGVRVSLDDFGTGSSSLTLLQEVPADVVKLDRSFVAAVAEESESRSIVESTVELAHRLGMGVVAEGIETRAQLDVLVAMGCDLLQGFLLSRPVDPESVPALVTGAR